MVSAVCKTCGKMFEAREAWMKICVECYKLQKGTKPSDGKLDLILQKLTKIEELLGAR